MKKLNSRGFSHDIILVAFVVIFAIAGVAYVVASHAATCTPASGVVSGTNCTLTARCNITNSPVQTAKGKVIRPVVVVTNTGTSTFIPSVTATVLATDRQNHQTTTTRQYTMRALAPGTTSQETLSQLPTALKASVRATSSFPSFSCANSFATTLLP